MEDVVIYNNGELELKIEVKNKTIWLRSREIALLFGVQRPAIIKHIKIFIYLMN